MTSRETVSQIHPFSPLLHTPRSGAKAKLVPKVPRWVRAAKDLPSTPVSLPYSDPSLRLENHQHTNDEKTSPTTASSGGISQLSRTRSDRGGNEEESGNNRGPLAIFRRRSSAATADLEAAVGERGAGRSEDAEGSNTGKAMGAAREHGTLSAKKGFPVQLPRGRRSSKSAVGSARPLEEEVASEAAARLSSANLLLPPQPARGKRPFKSDKGSGSAGGGPLGLFGWGPP